MNGNRQALKDSKATVNEAADPGATTAPTRPDRSREDREARASDVRAHLASNKARTGPSEGTGRRLEGCRNAIPFEAEASETCREVAQAQHKRTHLQALIRLVSRLRLSVPCRLNVPTNRGHRSRSLQTDSTCDDRMTQTREVALQTLAVLDQAETDIDLLMESGQPDQVAVAFGFLLRLLASSSSRMQVGMLIDGFDPLPTEQPVTGGHESGQSR